MVAGPGVVERAFHKTHIGGGLPAACGHIGQALRFVPAYDQERFIACNGFSNSYIAIEYLGEGIPGSVLVRPGELHESLFFPFGRKSHKRFS